MPVTRSSSTGEAAAGEPARSDSGSWARGAIILCRLSQPGSDRFALVALLLALAHIVQLIVIVLGRLFYPMDLEWMEGGLLGMASRMLQGLPVYSASDTGYVALPYPFAYPLLLAGLGGVLGFSYPLGRLVSIAFTLLAALVLAREVARSEPMRPRGVVLGLIAVGLIAAGFPLVDGWYDLVRVDSMAVALWVVAAALVADSNPSRRALSIAAVCLALSAFTKQSSAPFIAVIVVFALVRHRKQGAMLAGASLVLFLAGLGLAHALSGGGYWFYTVTIMAGHQVEVPRIGEAFGVLLRAAPYFPLLLLLSVLLAMRRHLRARTLLWGVLALVAWGSGALSMAKAGAHVNSLIPAVWVTPVWLMLVCVDLYALRTSSDPEDHLTWTWQGAAWLGVAGLLVFSWYPAGPHLVDAGRWRRAEALREYVAGLEGKVHATTIPFVAAELGKGQDQMHLQALGDLKWAGLGYRKRYAAFLEQTDPDYVIAAGKEVGVEVVYQRYALVDVLDEERYDVTTMVGWPVRPRLVFARKSAAPGARRLFDFERGEGWVLDGMRLSKRHAPGQAEVWGARGSFLNSFDGSRGDRATGRADSPLFVIDRPCLRLYVGGGSSSKTRVELVVDGLTTHQASGFDTEIQRRVDWDLRQFRGKQARLRAIDASREGWGHITLDEVILHRGCK